MTGLLARDVFGAASPAHWPILLGAASLLVDHGLPANHPWREQAQGDLDMLCGAAGEPETPDATALDRVVAALRDEKIQSEAPLAMFLAARVRNPDDRKIGNVLSAWILAAALQRLRITPKQNAIRQGLNAVRGLKTRAPAELRRLSLPLDTPEELLKQLDDARHAAAEKTVRSHFRAASALIRTALKKGPAIQQTREAGAASEVEPALMGLREHAVFEGVTRITGGFVPEQAGLAGPSALQRADQVVATVTLQGENDTGAVTPRRTAEARLRKGARAAARRELSLAAEHDPLTRHEAQTLTRWLDANADDPAHALLMADLVFGAAASDGVWTRQGGHLGLSLEVALPDFEPLVESDDAYSAKERLFLPAPPGAAVPTAGKAADDALATALKALRGGLARPLTRTRVVRFKADWLRRAGADAAIIGFLTGQSPGARAQMHYSCIAQPTLLDWHRRYLERGLGLSVPDWPPPDGVYGSRLRLPGTLLRAVFEEARREVRHHRLHGLGSTAQLAAAHNAFMIYTVMVLYLGSGHRPVSHPFEYRSDFDLEAGVLWISDKTGRGARGTRLLPLPHCAIAQVHAWIDHLERLRDRLRLTHAALADGPVAAALALKERDRGPFFFRLDIRGRTEALRPSVQEEAARPVLPAALNWTRHVLRSALLEECQPAALDAFLGHGHIGEDPFVSGASLRFADLLPVAEKIQGLMTSLSVKPVESPL
jgi:hypothetical protein